MERMTSLLSTPRRVAELSVRPLSDRPVVVAAVVVAVQSAAFGLLAILVVVLVGWATAADAGASAGEAVSASMYTWLVVHHAQLVVPGGEFGLPPLGLTAGAAWLLFSGAQRAARTCAVTDTRGAVAMTCVLAATYALLATVVSVIAQGDAVQPVPVTAFAGAGVVAGAAGGAGALRGAGATRALWLRLPLRVRLALRGGLAATALLLGGGSLLVAVSLAAHVGDVLRLMRSLDAGALGLLLLAVVSLAYLPTASVWATSYALGPGFAVGAGTSVALTGVDLGATPALPLLAALPAGAEPAPLTFGLLLLPAAAGAVAGVLLHRADRRRKVSVLATWRQVAALGCGTGFASAALLVAATLLAGGPGGPGRLAVVGPAWEVIGPVGGLFVAAVTTITIFALRPQTLRTTQAPARAGA